MTLKYDIRALIEAIKSLYSKFASLDLKRRMGAYHRGGGSGAGHDIGTTLAEDIDKLAVSSNSDRSSEPTDTSSDTDYRAVPHQSRVRTRIDRNPHQVTRRFTELTRFFKGRNNGSKLQPHMAERLKASVWEHINTSLRLARKGEATGAKLHAEVANNALKEAAQYMPEEAYAEFYTRVERRLREIRATTRLENPSERNVIG